MTPPAMRVPLAVAAALVLAGCDGTVTTTTSAPSFAPAAALPAAAAQGAFDGRYRGSWTTTLDLSGRCAAPTLSGATLTIAGERASLLHPASGSSAEGTIGPDGVFALRGTIGRFPAGVTGVVEGGRVRGAVRSRQCHYEFRMRRVG